MELEQSRTRECLAAACENALAACGRYHLYALRAGQEGYEQLAELLLGIARTECTRAAVLEQMLGKKTDALHALAEAAARKRQSWCEGYRQYALTAQEEGFEEQAGLFWQLLEIDRDQDALLRRAGRLLEAGALFSRPETCDWVCRGCGRAVRAAAAPESCPVCGAPQGAMQRAPIV